MLILDAINFGSGWFPTLRRRRAPTRMARRLTAHARAHGSRGRPRELRALDAAAVAAVLDQDAAHPLMALYAEALVQLGAWLGDRGALECRRGRRLGGALAAALAAGMPFFDDRGFYKRAQIAANDLALAGVAAFADIDRLTIFADNLVPHVLRIDGVLVYAPELAARIDARRGAPEAGGEEREIRAARCTRASSSPRAAACRRATLDNWLWNRGQRAALRGRAPHLTRTVFY